MAAVTSLRARPNRSLTEQESKRKNRCPKKATIRLRQLLTLSKLLKLQDRRKFPCSK